MKIKKLRRQGGFISLEDIKEIDTAFLDEIKRVKSELDYIKDKDTATEFYNVLMRGYNAAIDMRILEREVDYEIKFAEIKARRHELRPWRRCWLWRLLFRPLTNRAQDIIEDRAELDADFIHTAAENKIEEDRKKLPQDDGEKLSKREIKRRMREKLKEVIEQADSAETNEVLNEPAEGERKEAENKAESVQNPPQEKGQLPGQMQLRLDELPARRARPPRSCRVPRG